MSASDLEKRVQAIEDQLAIDRLEKIFGYYLDNDQMQKVVDLFSDNCESIEIGDRGIFKGKAGIRKFFFDYLGEGKPGDHNDIVPGRMAIHMQLQSVITINPDGKTADGRFSLIMMQARPIVKGGKPRSILGHGVYENEFIKEDGIWKFKKVFLSLHYRSPIGDGWTEVPNMSIGRAPGYDAEPTFFHPFPNLATLPFHFKHPVTGK